MKVLVFIATLLLKISSIIAQPNETKIESIYGSYYSFDELFSSDSSAMLLIKDSEFSIFFDWDQIVENDESDVFVIFPNHTGRIQLINDSTAILFNDSYEFTMVLDMSDSLCLKAYNSTMDIFGDHDFVRFKAYFSKKHGNETIKHYKTKWTYSRHALPDPSLIRDDNFFYFYNTEGELLEKVKDTAKIHPYSRLWAK